jgi:nucleoside-diphosphate-sugar epimerase
VTVLCTGRRPTPHPTTVQTLQCDIRDGAALRQALAGSSFEYVFNLAGYIDHRPYFAGGRAVIAQHLDGLMNLIDSIGRDELKGFVQIGSSDEFGDAPAPQLERTGSTVISPYAFAKLAATDFIRFLARQEGFPGTVARLFLTYGPGQDEKRFLPQVIRACVRNERFGVSTGLQVRDFCYVDNVVEGLRRAATCGSARGMTLNIASGRPITVREVVEKVVRLVGGGSPQFGARPYRPGENMALVADISKTSEMLGWEPTTSLEAGLMATIAAEKEHAVE